MKSIFPDVCDSLIQPQKCIFKLKKLRSKFIVGYIPYPAQFHCIMIQLCVLKHNLVWYLLILVMRVCSKRGTFYLPIPLTIRSELLVNSKPLVVKPYIPIWIDISGEIYTYDITVSSSNHTEQIEKGRLRIVVLDLIWLIGVSLIRIES